MKNIVLITIDCLRADRCGFNNHHRNTTPTLDSLSSDSLIYDRCYATGPYTTESFPGILAGQHSYNGSQYGDKVGYKALSADSPTLATELSNKGYQTAAVISNPHLTTNRNFHLGFDIFENFRSEADDDHDDDSGWDLGSKMYALREQMRTQPSRYNPLALLYAAYRFGQLSTEWPTTDGADLAERSEEVLQDFSEQDEPFFLWTHYMDVHAPISPRRADDGGLASIPTLRSLYWDASRAGRFYEPNYDSLYDSSVRYVDKQISRLIDQLQAIGELEDTVIIVTGDHGEILFDREDVYGHPPHYHYDGLLQVPLLVYDPEGPTGRIQNPVSLAWMHEIVAESLNLDFKGFPTASGLDSILKEGHQNNIVSDTLTESGHTVTVRDDKHKLILHRNVDGEEISWEYKENPVAYHYYQDCTERVPMDNIPQDLLTKAKSYLSSEAQLPEVQGNFSAATEQRLQDLGYKM